MSWGVRRDDRRPGSGGDRGPVRPRRSEGDPHVPTTVPGRTARAAGLEPMFAPAGIAVVGASRSPGKLGAVLARSLAGFGGHLALVNGRDETMYGSVRAAAAAGP